MDTQAIQQRTRKASNAMFIVAVVPAMMAAMAFASRMPELRPLIAGGLLWSVVLAALGTGVRFGSRLAAWSTFGLAVVLSALGCVHAVLDFQPGDVVGLTVLGLLGFMAVRASFRLARDLGHSRVA